MGAMLLALVHNLADSLPIPAASPRSAGVTGKAFTSAASASTLWIALAGAEKRLVVPPVRLPMFEAGVYFSRIGAQNAAASLAMSGVPTTIAGAGPYTLLIAPYGRRSQVLQVEQWLRNAEAPFFVRPWGAGGQAALLPASLRPRAAAVERWFAADEQLLSWLVNGGRDAVKGRDLWTAASLARASAGVSIANGALGRNLNKFSAAVQTAWREEGSGVAEQTAQTRALAALAGLQ